MKITITALAFALSFLSYSQIDNNSQTPKLKMLTICQTASIKYADTLSQDIINEKFQSFNYTIDKWVEVCGITEIGLRSQILKAIINKEFTKDLIKTYYKGNYYTIFKNRIQNAKEQSYTNLYNKDYYGYVPLGHQIDSVTLKKSLHLLKNNSLSIDEKLICLLFSDNNIGYNTELNKTKKNKSIIKKKEGKEKENINKSRWHGGISIYSGMYSPIGEKLVFNNTLSIGVGIGLSFHNKLFIEYALRGRINKNDKDFDYLVQDTLNTVNSKSTMYSSIFVGYPIFDNGKLIIYPKIGLGNESVKTGIVKKNKDKDDMHYNVGTSHYSAGVSIMTQIKNNLIGIELNYHYVPYGKDENLKTIFNNNAFSMELFIR